MPYVGPDGNLVNSKPWSMKSILDFIGSFFAIFILFFRGLFHLDEPDNRGQYGRPGVRGSGNAPAFPRRRMGGFTSGSSPAPPPCGTGG